MAIIHLSIKTHSQIGAMGGMLKYAQIYVKYLHFLHLIISYGFKHDQNRDGNFTFINKNALSNRCDGSVIEICADIRKIFAYFACNYFLRI